MSHLLALRVGEYWGYFWREPLSYRLACAYIFFEYYRIQSIYPVLDVLPWSMLCLLGGLAALFAEGRGSPRNRSAVDILLLVFAGVVLLSSVMAWNPAISFERWKQFWLWIPVYLLITRTVTSFRRLVLFLALWVLWSTKMAVGGVLQWASVGFAFMPWGVYGAPGWFQNSGEMGIQMVVFYSILVVSVAAMWRYLSVIKRVIVVGILLSAALSVVATSSRGAIGGLGIAMLWMILFTKYKVRALIGALVLGGFLFVATPPEFKDRFTTVGTDETSVLRRTYRERGVQLMREFPVLGIGYENWVAYYKARFGPRSQEPHNIYVKAGAELGYTGLLVFLSLALAGFLLNRETRQTAGRLATAGAEHAGLLRSLAVGIDAAQLGYLGAGYFVTVLYYPFFWINLALAVAVHTVTVAEARALGIAEFRGQGFLRKSGSSAQSAPTPRQVSRRG